VDEEMGYPRFAARGRTFVYVLPCRDEDLLKVGFSRDPLKRFHALHARFYEFFDLDRGLLIETDILRDARRIERLFISTFRDSRALAPLVVPHAAAGHTEWYRGIDEPVTTMAHELHTKDGFKLHSPLRPWLRARLDDHSDKLFQWSSRMLEMVEYEQFNPSPYEQAGRAARALREALDVHEALGFDLQELIPAVVLAWYRNGSDFVR
jgi:hypothetical protein